MNRRRPHSSPDVLVEGRGARTCPPSTLSTALMSTDVLVKGRGSLELNIPSMSQVTLSTAQLPMSWSKAEATAEHPVHHP